MANEMATVRVFKNDPMFNDGRAWWAYPVWKLNQLLVATYDVEFLNGAYPLTPECEEIQAIMATHADCVFVY